MSEVLPQTQAAKGGMQAGNKTKIKRKYRGTGN
jgi:hypothetical protein